MGSDKPTLLEIVLAPESPFRSPLSHTPAPPPEKLTALMADVGSPQADAWDVIDAAVGLIAAHYRLDLFEVWNAVLDLEHEAWERHGLDCFGLLLERPRGFAELGLRVAENLLGVGGAEAAPQLQLTLH